jgi:membrane protease YdiL (CAAX protease family)
VSEQSEVTLRRPGGAVVVGAGGCVLLALRPVLLRDGAHPALTLTVLFVALLGAGLLWPRRASLTPTSNALPVLALGLAAFALGRLVGGGHALQPFAVRVVALSTLAAVAEEEFFRRLVFDALLPAGAGVAVVGSAVLFAVVHVTVYGMWVLPIDLAAGLVLSWQRWASGSWRVPALTHVVANLLVVIS